MAGQAGFNASKRAIVLIIDGCGVGAAPDALAFGDADSVNSLANTAKECGGLKLPNLASLGLGYLSGIQGVAPAPKSLGYYGKLKELSCGKDTQTGHWELMGLVSETAFPVYPQGFPPEVIDQFIEKTGCKGILSNKPASGTEILVDLGEEHQRTGFPIVYTSGDSVFQIACHVETIPLKTLYQWCEIARELLQGEHRVGRVIARPFAGEPGHYERLGGERRDYSVPPPEPTFMDLLIEKGSGVLGIGKIEDIFNKCGVSHAIHTGSNKQGLELTLDAINGELGLESLALNVETPNAKVPNTVNFIFTNLVDTDMLYGHRRNVKGYGKALEEIDEWLGKIMQAMSPEDLLIISSDHGNDPTAPGTDHTREFVPLLAYSPGHIPQSAEAANLGIRDGFFDVAAELASWLEVDWKGRGKSFLPAKVRAT